MQYNLNLYPRLVQPPDANSEIMALQLDENALTTLEADMQAACA